MTDTERPQNPLPPDDELLEEFLARRSALNEAWRQGSESLNAPSALDQAIAQVAAEAQRGEQKQTRHRERAGRWRAPFGVAATVVLGVGLIRLAVYDPATRQALQAPQAVPLETTISNAPAAPERAAEPVGETPTQQNAAADAHVPQKLAKPAPTSKAKTASSAAVPSTPAVAADSEIESARQADVAARQREESMRQAQSLQQQAQVRRRAMAADAGPSALPPPPPAPVQQAVPMSAPLPALKAATPPSDLVALAPTAHAATPGAAYGAATVDSNDHGVMSKAASLQWQPGRWQGLQIGSATRDDVLRRFGAATVEDDSQTNASLVGGRRQHLLLRFDHTADPRGIATAYIDANSQALASVTLALKPPLPLTQVLNQEALQGLTPQLHSPGAMPCSTSSPALPAGAALDPTQYPLNFNYPEKGVVLLLSTAGKVSEIAWYEQRCN